MTNSSDEFKIYKAIFFSLLGLSVIAYQINVYAAMHSIGLYRKNKEQLQSIQQNSQIYNNNDINRLFFVSEIEIRDLFTATEQCSLARQNQLK